MEHDLKAKDAELERAARASASVIDLERRLDHNKRAMRYAQHGIACLLLRVVCLSGEEREGHYHPPPPPFCLSV